VVVPETKCPPVVVQLKVAPAVEEEPFRITEADTQVIVLSAPAFTFGGVLFNITAATSVAWHPFTGFVTVKVYDPAASTVGVDVVPPLTIWPLVVQLKVAPAVEEDPFNTTEVELHVIVLSIPAFTSGGVLFSMTTATSVAWHPFTGFVTVKV
jgi:hypothetical protein